MGQSKIGRGGVNMYRTLSTLAALSLLVTLCNSAPASPFNPGCSCFQKVDPVCGVDGETYGNTCSAVCAGVGVAHKGACGTSFFKPTNCICFQKFDPVCGVDGKIYSNTCSAGCAGVGVDYEGTCGLKKFCVPN